MKFTLNCDFISIFTLNKISYIIDLQYTNHTNQLNISSLLNVNQSCKLFTLL